MKTSTMLILCLTGTLLTGAVICDFILASNYRKMDLSDPYKNFHNVPVKPFKVLYLSGGNGYAVTIRQADEFNIKLMNSRTSFFKMSAGGDTAFITFNVANQTYQKPTDCVTGLIVSVPSLQVINLNGTNTTIGPFQQDNMQINAGDKTAVRLMNLNAQSLHLEGVGSSSFDFESKNKLGNLTFELGGRSAVLMHDVNFEKFNPIISDSATVTFFREPLAGFRRSVK